MTIFIGADHGGYRLKEELEGWLKEWGHTVVDVGFEEFDSDDDYPAIAFAVAEHVVNATADELTNEKVVGILACRSGGGMTIAANKVVGARAVTVTNTREVKHARNDNDANVISLPADWITRDSAEDVVRLFLETPFSKAPRHLRRIKQIHQYEQSS